MALPNVGVPLSLNEIHIEVGGASATLAALNDADIRALIGKASGATNSINEYYGASSGSPIVATGGSISTSGGYRYHTFTSTGYLNITSLASGSISNTLQVLAIGGGGGGGALAGGGGGAGRRRVESIAATTGNKLCQIGAGGGGLDGGYYNEGPNARYGGWSRFFGGGSQADGGGSGGSRFSNHGGTSHVYSGGTGQNYNNPDSGLGGGGAGTGGNGTSSYPGQAGFGGIGYLWLNGTRYGGGGGGGVLGTGNTGGGNDGGGAGGYHNVSAGGNATFYGAGGGGGGTFTFSGSGFQGIVIIRYEYP